jgi:TPR repeat protein
MQEILPNDVETRPKRMRNIVICVWFALVLSTFAAVKFGWLWSADAPKVVLIDPAAAPVPSASVAVKPSSVAKPADVLPVDLPGLVSLASGGNALACIEVGERYRIGKGCIRDEEEALRWYDKAASVEDQAGLLRLAKAYEALGQFHRAEGSFEKLALRGVHEAQLWMAHRHLKDEKVDVSDTYAWFNICAAWGDADSVATRNYMDKLYPAVIVAKGQVRARAIVATIQANEVARGNPGRGVLLKQKALSGDRTAQVELADAYLAGSDVERDFSEAERWYKLAAESGSIEASASLARYYEVAFKTDYALARSYHLKASMAGHVYSQFSVAERYRSGINGFEIDTVEAYAWYNVCAASGNPDAVAARDFLEGQMISTQKSAAQKRSRELLRQIEANKAKK